LGQATLRELVLRLDPGQDFGLLAVLEPAVRIGDSLAEALLLERLTTGRHF
jgi:hypothetical protein